jgi:adenosyl cobinamide kinase/adenosyl cobinamide phosphate guanylyltransferase
MPGIPGDLEQEEKIAKHKLRRPPEWHTVEAETNVHEVIPKLPVPEVMCMRPRDSCGRALGD